MCTSDLHPSTGQIGSTAVQSTLETCLLRTCTTRLERVAEISGAKLLQCLSSRSTEAPDLCGACVLQQQCRSQKYRVREETSAWNRHVFFLERPHKNQINFASALPADLYPTRECKIVKSRKEVLGYEARQLPINHGPTGLFFAALHPLCTPLSFPYRPTN